MMGGRASVEISKSRKLHLVGCNFFFGGEGGLQDVAAVITSLVEQTNKMGLDINERKTTFMTV